MARASSDQRTSEASALSTAIRGRRLRWRVLVPSLAASAGIATVNSGPKAGAGYRLSPAPR
ncbi:hypothetical protein [Sorangium sp. So ce693]|uniref:hypothetical protein n=1 Tax=Sorangium sp. So ce693 TaxID=3133318 RepID=UPI003F61EECC